MTKVTYARAELLSEWEHIWDRHRGDMEIAAAILGISYAALSRALYRARADGCYVKGLS